MPAVSTVERAFELARSGRCDGVEAIRKQLSVEGYLDARPQICGPSLIRELTTLCRDARAEARRPLTQDRLRGVRPH